MPDPTISNPDPTLQPDLPPPAQELALLRAQLSSLADLARSLSDPGASTQNGLAQPWEPPAAPHLAAGSAQEAFLLKDILTALLHQLETHAPAASSLQASPPPPPDQARVEAAMTQLLKDLVQETDRRIRAETEAARARALLHNHGFQDRPAPSRLPTPPRRGA